MKTENGKLFWWGKFEENHSFSPTCCSPHFEGDNKTQALFIQQMGFVDHHIWIVTKENMFKKRVFEIIVSDSEENSVYFEMDEFNILDEIYDQISSLISVSKNMFLVICKGDKKNSIILDHSVTIGQLSDDMDSFEYSPTSKNTIQLGIIGADPLVPISLTQELNNQIGM